MVELENSIVVEELVFVVVVLLGGHGIDWEKVVELEIGSGSL